MINLPVYKIASGIADLTNRRAILEMVSNLLVCQTSLKNDGRLLSAEKRSFKLMTAISIIDDAKLTQLICVMALHLELPNAKKNKKSTPLK
ncbi:MAG: hypothetical protein ABIU77_27840 [Ferruginibacter sp.]